MFLVSLAFLLVFDGGDARIPDKAVGLTEVCRDVDESREGFQAGSAGAPLLEFRYGSLVHLRVPCEYLDDHVGP